MMNSIMKMQTSFVLHAKKERGLDFVTHLQDLVLASIRIFNLIQLKSNQFLVMKM